MENIINKIIEIDSIAQKKLDDARDFKVKLENDFMKEKETLSLLLDQKVKTRINIVLDTEKSFCNEQKILIEQKKISSLDKLDKIFNDTHSEIEGIIFKNIISS